MRITIPFGSVVYGTVNRNSDEDYYTIDMKGGDMYEHVQSDGVDEHILGATKFKEMLDNHHIAAMEVYFYSPQLKQRFTFELDKEKLRRSISKVVSNSWVKSKKKEIDGEEYIGRKSMWHSIRILLYGIQIAKYGEIVDFEEANQYYDEIVNGTETVKELMNNYKPFINSKQSEFRVLCPFVKGE